MKNLTRRTFLGAACALPAIAAQAGRKTRNVLLVMTDGLRCQEVFGGADEGLLKKESKGDAEWLRRDFWRDTPAARREALLPFFWKEMAAKGQVYGNRAAGSEAYVTNGMNFSYPGYSETLCGFGDPRIDSNDKNPNPNVTVLEWLHGKPAYRGKVAAFGAWDTFPAIINAQRAGFPVNAGNDPLQVTPLTQKLQYLNQLKAETVIWESEALDALTFHTALEYFKEHKPRVLFLSLGETDEWAHAGNYENYLRSARRVDQYLRQIWETAQSMKQYRDSTSLIFLPDHGRGEAPVEWKSHGQKIPDSKYIWMGFLGPDTKPMGERKNVPAVTQSQIAGTVSALLGEDYNAAVPKAGRPIADVIAASNT